MPAFFPEGAVGLAGPPCAFPDLARPRRAQPRKPFPPLVDAS
jgi:hypothetical protein